MFCLYCIVWKIMTRKESLYMFTADATVVGPSTQYTQQPRNYFFFFGIFLIQCWLSLQIQNLKIQTANYNNNNNNKAQREHDLV